MVTNEPPKGNASEFPALFRHTNGQIVLFTAPSTGILVKVGNAKTEKLKRISGVEEDDWWNCADESVWKRLKVGESVTLYQA